MWRYLLAVAVLAVAAAPARAQAPTPTAAPDVCARGGADAQYADCPAPACSEDSADADYAYGCACRLEGADADYTYACPEAAGGHAGPPTTRRRTPTAVAPAV